MKRICLTLLFALAISSVVPAYADQAAEGILKAIVKIRSTVPKDAHTASTLGTEREGNGVVIGKHASVRWENHSFHRLEKKNPL